MFQTTQTFTNAQIKKAAALRQMAQKKQETMEYGNVTLKKVKNLSRSDIDEIYDAMDRLVATHEDPYLGRLQPSKDIKQVYINAGVYTA